LKGVVAQHSVTTAEVALDVAVVSKLSLYLQQLIQIDSVWETMTMTAVA
jgi:hypothetical protein